MRLIALVLIGLTCAVSGSSVPKLSELKVQLDVRETLPLSPKISLEFMTRTSRDTAAELAQFEGVSVSDITDDSVIITLIERSHFSEPVSDSLTQNSFVIDFEEQSVIDFIDGFKSQSSEGVEWQTLPVYVSEYIDNPTYIHGFNIASIVARDRSGDCTEYAVLTTALARAVKMPSRVIFGAVIVENSDNVEAFGHAWTEIWDGEQWQIADAAMIDADVTKIFYLPTGVLDNEGPGYAMSLMSAVRYFPDEIRHLKSVN